MKTRNFRALAAITIVAGLAQVNLASAIEFDPAEGYMQRLKAQSEIAPVGSSPFGESVNPYTGELSFSHVDVALEGSGPTIVVGRRTLSSQDAAYTANTETGRWDLTIPRIESMLVANSGSDLDYTSSVGYWWRTTGDNGIPLYARCSHLKDTEVSLKSLGIELFDEHGQSHEILARDIGNTAKPDASLTNVEVAAGAPGVTLDNWQIACLSATSNGEVGEAFLAISPDGTKYWFDYLVGSPVEFQDPEQPGVVPVRNLYGSPMQILDYWKNYFGVNYNLAAYIDVLFDYRQSNPEPEHMEDGGRAFFAMGRNIGALRTMGVMYVTRIEDRFGNAITYSYNNGRIAAITGTDGRKVEFVWNFNNSRLEQVKVYPGTANERIWTYDYLDPPAATVSHLSKVTRPDGSSWELGRPPITGSGYLPLACGLYSIPGLSNAGATPTVQMTVKSPEGATGVFGLGVVYHQRSNVTEVCRPPNSQYDESEVREAPIFITASVLTETISGPGIEPRTWNYKYAPTKIEYCGNNVNCAGGPQNSPKWMDTIDPAGNRTRRYYDNRKGWLEGKLVREEFYHGDSTLLRSVDTTYAGTDAGPWPAVIGKSLSPHIVLTDGYSNSLDLEKRESISPVQEVKTTQQGKVFKMHVNTFDSLARPTNVTRSTDDAP